MSAYEINGASVEHDEEGYITNLGDWSKELAEVIAKAEDIEMDDERWEVVNFLREYYEEYQIAPAVRVLIKAVKKTMGEEKGKTSTCTNCSLMAQPSKPVRSLACPSRLAVSDKDKPLK